MSLSLLSAVRQLRGRSRRVRSNLLAGPPGSDCCSPHLPIQLLDGAIRHSLLRKWFIEGQNLTSEAVRLDQDAQQLFAQTADLVRSNVELLVTEGNEIALQAAMAARPQPFRSSCGPAILIRSHADM